MTHSTQLSPKETLSQHLHMWTMLSISYSTMLSSSYTSLCRFPRPVAWHSPHWKLVSILNLAKCSNIRSVNLVHRGYFLDFIPKRAQYLHKHFHAAPLPSFVIGQRRQSGWSILSWGLEPLLNLQEKFFSSEATSTEVFFFYQLFDENYRTIHFAFWVTWLPDQEDFFNG